MTDPHPDALVAEIADLARQAGDHRVHEMAEMMKRYPCDTWTVHMLWVWLAEYARLGRHY